MGSTIIGCGKSLPKLEVANDELKALVDTNDEWISTRTGIRSRHVAVEETATDLAEAAARQALGLADGGWREDGEAILGASGGPGQVDDEGPMGQPGDAATEDRGRDSLGHAVRANRLGNPGDGPIDHAQRDLRGEVGGGETGAPRGDDQVDPVGHRVTQCPFDRIAVAHDDGAGDVEAEAAQARDQHGSGTVFPDACRCSGGHRDHARGASVSHDAAHLPL